MFTTGMLEVDRIKIGEGPWSVVKKFQHDKGQYYFLTSLILWVLNLTITVRQVDLLIFYSPALKKWALYIGFGLSVILSVIISFPLNILRTT